MRIIIAILLGLSLSTSIEAQSENFKNKGVILAYDSLRHEIQTSGTDSSMTYKIFRAEDGLLVKKGKMICTFIPLPEADFPLGQYSVLFQAKYRYKNTQFTIR